MATCLGRGLAKKCYHMPLPCSTLAVCLNLRGENLAWRKPAVVLALTSKGRMGEIFKYIYIFK